MTKIETIKQTYQDIVVIVSPPRCSSTALARVFWEHPLIDYYAHEPFESLYFLGKGLDDAFGKILAPMALEQLKFNSVDFSAESPKPGLVIKEMPYQVGPHFDMLLGLATAPIVFLMRDPRLNIASRMRKKQEVGDSPLFPHIETGWQLLQAQIKACDAAGVPYVIVDSRDFRNHSSIVLCELFGRIGLSYSDSMLHWLPQASIDIDNLEGTHSHLYDQVLNSERLLLDDSTIPPIESFPEANGLRAHVRECLDIYAQLRLHKQFIDVVDMLVV